MVPRKSVLILFACIFFAACHNSVMERWWDNRQDDTCCRNEEIPPPNGTGENGGNGGNGGNGASGANFGVVHFDTGGGNPSPENLSIAWGNVVGRLRPMERETYGFQGWFDENGNPWNVETRPVRPEDDVDNDGFISLTAGWAQVSYTVTFEVPRPHSATGDPVAPPPQMVAPNGLAVPPVNPISGTGLGFGGWFTRDGTDDNYWGWQWDFAENTVNSDITLVARWSTFQTRTVVLMANAGTRPTGQELTRNHFTIPILGKIQDPGPLARLGHSFGGWFTDLDFTNQWNFADDIVMYPDLEAGVDPFYLYANWIPNIYFVSFAVNSETASQPGRQEVAHDQRVARPAVTNPGMVLVGWFTEPGGTVEWDFDRDTVVSTMTLYAQWEDAVYTVTFNLSRRPPGGAAPPQPDNQLVVYRGRILEPFMPPPSAGSHGFLRWDYDVDGSLQPWNFETGVVENDLTLYARWVPPVPDMVWVPRGSFTMGDPGVSGSPAAYHAFPTRRVTLDGFYIGRHLVTQALFEDVMSDNDFGITARPSQFQGQLDRPVERVSWFDAIAFANKMSVNASRPEVYTISNEGTGLASGSTTVYNITSADVYVDWTKSGFRLPTEAEWEFAARGGHDSPGGFSHAGGNNALDFAWFNTNSGSQTRPVGTRAPNALGIFDMNGNVYEWCWDWFDSYKNIVNANPGAEANNNPKGPTVGTERVRRGGSWNNAVGNVRNVVRNSAPPGNANWVIGFRLALSPNLDEIY